MTVSGQICWFCVLSTVKCTRFKSLFIWIFEIFDKIFCYNLQVQNLDFLNGLVDFVCHRLLKCTRVWLEMMWMATSEKICRISPQVVELMANTFQSLMSAIVLTMHCNSGDVPRYWFKAFSSSASPHSPSKKAKQDS